MKRIKHFLNEGSWIAFGQVSAALGAILGVRLLTGHLNPSVYGELALWTTVATLINQTVLGPLSNGITRFYAPASESGQIGLYISSVSHLVKQALAGIIVFAMFGAIVLVSIGRATLLPLVITFVFFSAFNGCSGILSGIQNAARQRKTVAVFQGVDSWLRFLTATALVILLGAASINAAIGYVISAAILFFIQYKVFRKNSSLSINIKSVLVTNWSSEIWRFSWPFASWGIFTWARLASDRWALDIFSTKEQVGFYAVVFQLGYYPMSLATGMATQLFAPILYQKAGNAASAERNAEVNSLSMKLVRIALTGSGVAFVLALCLHRQIFDLLASHAYLGVSYLFPWVVLAGGIFATTQLIGLDLMTRLQTRMLVICTVCTSLLGIVLNMAGAYYFSLDGVVGAGLIYSIVYFVWMYLLSVKTRTSHKPLRAKSGPL